MLRKVRQAQENGNRGGLLKKEQAVMCMQSKRSSLTRSERIAPLAKELFLLNLKSQQISMY